MNLYEINDMIHNGLPLSYKRDKRELKLRTITEYLGEDKKLIDICGEVSYISELKKNKLSELHKFIFEKRALFYKKNVELIKELEKQKTEKMREAKESGQEINNIDIHDTIIYELFSKVELGHASPVPVYRKLKEIEVMLKTALKEVGDQVSDLVEQDKDCYPEFNVSYRRTYKINENPKVKKMKEKLKTYEDLVKQASEMKEKGNTLVDENGEIVEAVSYSQSRVLKYTPKKNKK